jgi:hypothetical protein
MIAALARDRAPALGRKPLPLFPPAVHCIAFYAPFPPASANKYARKKPTSCMQLRRLAIAFRASRNSPRAGRGPRRLSRSDMDAKAGRADASFHQITAPFRL